MGAGVGEAGVGVEGGTEDALEGDGTGVDVGVDVGTGAGLDVGSVVGGEGVGAFGSSGILVSGAQYPSPAH